MSTPLRWAYPESYKALRKLSEEIGVHTYEYEALVDTGTPSDQVVKLQRNTNAWSQAFDPEELRDASASVMNFFSAAIREMADKAEQDYRNFMNHHEV